MKLLTIFLIVGAFYIYILLCAAIMTGIEKYQETERADLAEKEFADFKQSKPCITPTQITSILKDLDLLQRSGLRLSSTGVSGTSWDFPSSILMALQSISGVGFGGSSPKTLGGKIFFIFFTFFGLAVFIASALAIGGFLVEVVDWVRKKLGIKGGLKKAIFIHSFRIGVLLFVGLIIFGVIPAAIFAAIDPNFGFAESFSVVSVAIVGYADQFQDENIVSSWYKLGVGIWAILSLLWFTATFTTLRHILQMYNSGAIILPDCCIRKKDSDNIDEEKKPNEKYLDPFEENQSEEAPFASEDMLNPTIERAVIVMAQPHSHSSQDLNALPNDAQKETPYNNAQRSIVFVDNLQPSQQGVEPTNLTSNFDEVSKRQLTVIDVGSMPPLVPGVHYVDSNENDLDEAVNIKGLTTVLDLGKSSSSKQMIHMVNNENGNIPDNDVVMPTTQKSVIMLDKTHTHEAPPLMHQAPPTFNERPPHAPPTFNERPPHAPPTFNEGLHQAPPTFNEGLHQAPPLLNEGLHHSILKTGTISSIQIGQ